MKGAIGALLGRNYNHITLPELKVPTNTPEGLQEARRRKQLKPKYLALLNDLETLGFQSTLETIEVGTLGHFNNQTIASLHALLPNLRKNSVRCLLLGLSKTSVSCSAHIFNARLSTTWISPPFTRPFPSTNWPPPGPYPPIKSNLLFLFQTHVQVHVYILLYCPTSLLTPTLWPSPFPQNTPCMSIIRGLPGTF